MNVTLRFVYILSLVIALKLPPSTPAQERNSSASDTHAGRLQTLVDNAIHQTLEKFADKKLKPDQLAVTLVDLRDPQRPVKADYRGDAQIYPASVIKLFYLVAAHQWMEDGKLQDTPELRRAMRDMIVESYNEATHYIVDLLTDTTSGPELPPGKLEDWVKKRNAVNRYFASLGYGNINANKKPWCEGPYGRETQAIQAFKPSRNWLTTDATARLMTEIATGKAVSAKRSLEMMALLRRDPFSAADKDLDNQAKFTGQALPPGSKLWSKAGWTSETRHDAAYIELPDGSKFVVVVFTMDHANERALIATVTRMIVSEISRPK